MGTLWWACSMIFLLTFAVLQTVVYSDLGYSSIACLAIGLAVLRVDLNKLSWKVLPLALQMGAEADRLARRLSKEDFCRTEL